MHACTHTNSNEFSATAPGYVSFNDAILEFQLRAGKFLWPLRQKRACAHGNIIAWNKSSRL